MKQGGGRLYKGGGEQAGPSRPLEGSFVPAVPPLAVHQHSVVNPQLQLVLRVGRVGHDATEALPRQHRVLAP